jgi:dihydrodipicolinate synthase/N-acetylneuraminate lyase
MTISLKGIFAPVTTPFDKNGDVDRAAFEHNCKAHMQAGLNGIVVCGSTGEAPLINLVERQSLIEWARQHAATET